MVSFVLITIMTPNKGEKMANLDFLGSNYSRPSQKREKASDKHLGSVPLYILARTQVFVYTFIVCGGCVKTTVQA